MTGTQPFPGDQINGRGEVHISSEPSGLRSPAMQHGSEPASVQLGWRQWLVRAEADLYAGHGLVQVLLCCRNITKQMNELDFEEIKKLN